MADEYIEREAAVEAVKKEREYVGKFSFEEERAWTVGFHQGISFALSDIATVPAADVAPVRHGRWERKVEIDGGLKREYFVCSECGQTRMLNFHNYCPACGAKMDGGTE